MINSKEVQNVAALARLALSDDESRLYTEHLAKILDFFSQLNEVDTDGVEPLSHPLPITNVMRVDEIVTSPGSEIMLANAPDKEGPFIKVPKI